MIIEELKWQSMKSGHRKTFMIIQGLHTMYINRCMGKRYKDLPIGLKQALKVYKIQ